MARRLRGAALAAPVPVVVGAALLVASPIVLHRAGAALAQAIGAQLGAVDVAQGLVLALCLAGAIFGLMIGIAVPPRSAIGVQLSAAPVGTRAAMAAMVAPPLAVGGALMAPLAFAFVVPIAQLAPGGGSAAASTVGAVVAASALGLFVAECARASLRRDRGVLLAGAVLLAVWAGSIAFGSAATLGPLAVAADALAGRTSILVAVAVETALLAGSALGWWVLLARGKPRSSTRTPRVVLPTPSEAYLAVVVAVVRLVLRRPDIRLAFGVGIVLGVSSLALGGAAPTARVVLAGSSVALATALAPLALTGILLGGRSTWRGAPVRPGVVVGPAACVVLVLVLAPTAAVVAAVTAFVDGGLGDGARVLLVAALTAAAALAGGALIPWRGDRLGDQLASFAAFGACAAVASLGASVIGPRLATVGAPDVVVMGAVLGAVAAVGVIGVASRLARAS